MVFLKEVKVFVASPGDVGDERDAVESVAEEVNATLGVHFGLHLTVLRAEKVVVPDLGRPQQIINNQIGPYDIFVGIMWRRFGTATGKAGSGTEEEFGLAFEHWKKERSPRVMFYFCERPHAVRLEDMEQVQKVLEFRKKLETQGVFHVFSETHQFKDVLRKDLFTIVLSQFLPAKAAPAPAPKDPALPAPQAEAVAVATGGPVSPTMPVPEPIPQTGTVKPSRSPQQEMKAVVAVSRKRIDGGHAANIGLGPKQVAYLAAILTSGRFRNVQSTPKARAQLEEHLQKAYPRVTDEYIPTFHVLDRPVTVEMFSWFVEDTGYATRAEREKEASSWRSLDREARKDHPVTYVCREDVERFCLWVKDLCGFREVRTPTSREFEYMVRGGAGSDYLFSWGQEFEPNQCNDIFWGGHKGTAPYDAFERSRELKLWDLCGNVTEWLHDAAPKKAGYFQVAGASFRRVALYWGHASARGLAAAYTASDEVGFRIVVND